MTKRDRSKDKGHRKRNFQLFKEDVKYNLKNSNFKSKVQAFAKLAILLLILVGIPIFLLITMRDSILSTEYWASLPERLANHKKLSFIILILLQMAQIVISVLPGQPIQLAGSYLYGVFGGYIISLIGAVLGSIITYYIAGFLGRDALHVVFGEERVNDYVHKLNSSKAYLIIFLIYLIPGIPKDIVSYVAGVSEVRARPFILISTIGRTPGVLGSLLIGKFIKDGNYVGIGVTAVIVAIIFLICWKNKDKLMKKLSSYEDPDSEVVGESEKLN